MITKRCENMPDKNWQFELEEYIKQGESESAEKSKAWQTSIGLQAVDGLNTSEYLLKGSHRGQNHHRRGSEAYSQLL